MPSDQPAQSGQPVELSSGLFETPLFRHQARVVEDGIRVSTKPALDDMQSTRAIPGTGITLPDMDAAQKYVTAFDKAVAHRAISSDAGVVTVGFRANPDNPSTLQTVAKERVATPRAGAGTFDYKNSDRVYTDGADRVSQYGGRSVGLTDPNGEGLSIQQSYFNRPAQLAARAARDHMAHDAQATMAATTGHATLPLANAERMVADFVRVDAGTDRLPTSRQHNDKLPELGENDRRFQLKNGKYIQITGSPDQPEASQWAVHQRVNTGPGTDDYRFDEVASGPLTVDGLEQMMQDQSSHKPTEGLAREMRRATDLR